MIDGSEIPSRPVSDQMKFMHDGVNQYNGSYFPQFCMSMRPCIEELFFFIYSLIHFPLCPLFLAGLIIMLIWLMVSRCLVAENVLLRKELALQVIQIDCVPCCKPGHTCTHFIISEYAVIQIIL